MLLSVVSILLLIPYMSAQECEQKLQGPRFSRIMVSTYKGPNAVIANRTMAAQILGDCRSTNEHAEEMFRYFEGFGIDLSPMRVNPYEVYDARNFTVTPYGVNPKGHYRVIATSTFDYAQVTNSPMLFSSWVLSAKTDLNGPLRKLPTGHWAISGMFRYVANFQRDSTDKLTVNIS